MKYFGFHPRTPLAATAILVLLGISILHGATTGRLTQGRFGKAVDLSREKRRVIINLPKAEYALPLTFTFWAKLDGASDYNILLASGPKSEKTHWEVFTAPKTGLPGFFSQQLPGQIAMGKTGIVDGRWHFIGFRIEPRTMQLYVDGALVAKADCPTDISLGEAPIMIGAVQGKLFKCEGVIDEWSMYQGTPRLEGVVPAAAGSGIKSALHYYAFESLSGDDVPDLASGRSQATATIMDSLTPPSGNIFLDEVQRKAFASSGIYGDEKVRDESKLPALEVEATAWTGDIKPAQPEVLSLNGEWLMKDSEHFYNVLRNPRAASRALMDHWYKSDLDRSGWDRVQVPTTVQTALLKLGKMQDPLWNANTYDELIKYGEPKDQFKDAQWNRRLTRVEQRDWWFARNFTLPAEWKGKQLRLSFDGVDYSASFYLNGQPLGYHAGMFGGPEYDISDMANFGESNCLVVQVDRIPPDCWWDGILKGSPGWGWHYGHLVSLGIWKGVSVAVVPSVEISAPYVITKSLSPEEAKIQIEYYVDSHEPGLHHYTIGGTIQGENFSAPPVHFANSVEVSYGRSRYRTEIVLKNPHVWWPVNYGDPNLYRMDLTALDEGGKISSSNTTSTRFGVRTIEMRAVAGTTPESDYRWQFVINNQPMFIKGANWCWSDPMLQLDPAKYERLLELARRAGIQMFRSWGGGIVETDEFYRLCDEKGLMVYQEFPFCWGPADFPGTDPVVEDQQVSTVIKRLRNHPSLVMWGGGNENKSHPATDEALFLAGKRCLEFDPSRPFHRTDSWGGSTHNWLVYHHREPFDVSYPKLPAIFYGEFGLPSMPNLSSVGKFWPEATIEKWPPAENDGGVLQHLNQFSIHDILKNFGYCDYGPIKSWKDYIEYSQMAQGDWLRFAAEGQRAGSGFNKTGLWFYKFSDLFPGQSWSVVDFYGEPKLSYYRARQTYLPQIAFASCKKLNWADGEPFQTDLEVSNDTGKDLASTVVTATIYGSDLKPLWNKDYQPLTLAPNMRVVLDSIKVSIPPAQNKPFLLALSLKDASGKLLSDQWYWFNFQAPDAKMKQYAWPKEIGKFTNDDFRGMFKAYAEAAEAPLLSLPRTHLTAQRLQSGNRGVLCITNTGAVPAFNVLVGNFPDGWKNFLGDNSFCLRPGETREIAFEAGNETPLRGVLVKAWNADEVKVD